MTTLTPSCAFGHEICELHPPETFRASPGLYRYCFIPTCLTYTYWVGSWMGCRGVLDEIVIKSIPFTIGDSVPVVWYVTCRYKVNGSWERSQQLESELE